MTSNNFIKKSILPDLVLPEEHVTDLIFRTGLTQFPDKVALIDGANGRTFTYKQIHEGIKKVAASLHKRGFKAKEVFCIYSPNILEYVLAFHGVLKIGGIVTTVNPLYSAEELSRQLSDCKAVYIVTIPSSLDKATEASKKVGGIREIFVFGEAEGATPFDSLLDIDEEVKKRFFFKKK